MTRGAATGRRRQPCHPGSAAGAIRDVGDVEADDALALQLRAEAALEFGAVGALHDEDEVGLVEVVGRDRLLRIGRQAGGGGLDAGARGEDPLGRGGAEAVAGAEEEEVGQGYPVGALRAAMTGGATSRTKSPPNCSKP